MGTIDISYFNLLVGLLLLAIPLFYLWKFKTGLLKATLIDGAHDYTALPDRHVPQIPVPVEQSMD